MSLEKHVACVEKKVISLACVKAKRTRYNLYRNDSQPQGMSTKRNKRNHPIRISPSKVRVNKPCPRNCPTVEVRVNGVKWRLEADSCSTANIIDEHKLDRLQSSLKNKSAVHLTDTRLFAFAQREPVPLVGCFDSKIKSISTGSRTIATFLVAKGTPKSRPLLCLDTCVGLGWLHVPNATHEKKTEMASHTSAPSTDPVVTKLTSEYHKISQIWGKHKLIKAMLIVNEDIHPAAHKQRRNPYNLAQKAVKEEQKLKDLGIIETVPDNHLVNQPRDSSTATQPRGYTFLFWHEYRTLPSLAL